MVTNVSWRVSGEYFETCSCTYLCPCLPTNMAGQPSQGHCYFAMALAIGRGRYGDQPLDGLNFAVVGYTPGVMAGWGPSRSNTSSRWNTNSVSGITVTASRPPRPRARLTLMGGLRILFL